MQTIPDYEAAAALLHELLSLTPIFENGKFDTERVFNTLDCKEFGKYSRKLSKFVATQLGVSTRLDVIKKPVQHLWKLLELVEVEKDGSIKPKKINGVKIYNYKICTESHDSILGIVEHRAAHGGSDGLSSGWSYLDKHHGIKYSAEELDYLLRG